MTNEDYQLEELENAAVNKSNNAKRIAAAAGLVAAGGGAAFAATQIPFGSDNEQVETLTEDDLDNLAETGANQVEEPEVAPQTEHHHHPRTDNVQTPPPAETDNDTSVTFDSTTQFYDEDNNLVGTMEEGTIDGRQFKLLDVDGDLRADYLAYDADGNGIINDDEIVELYGNDQIAMGHATSHHDVVFVETTDPVEPIYPIDPIEPIDIYEKDDVADNNIHNDFDDEKTGEVYSHDYAENNEDYNNNGDIDNYSAGMSEESDYAYEDYKDESDYDYNDFAENDTTDDMFDDGSDSLDIM